MAPQIPIPVTYFAPCLTKQPPGALFIHFVIPQAPHIITFFFMNLYFQSNFSRQMNQSKMVKIVDISCSAKPREIGRDTTSVVKYERNYTFSEFDRCCVRVSTPTLRSISRHLSDWRDNSRTRSIHHLYITEKLILRKLNRNYY